jgi:hypothetical protein
MKSISKGLFASTLMGLGLLTALPAQAGDLTRVGTDFYTHFVRDWYHGYRFFIQG